jgi:hypothetical protein
MSSHRLTNADRLFFIVAVGQSGKMTIPLVNPKAEPVSGPLTGSLSNNPLPYAQQVLNCRID